MRSLSSFIALVASALVLVSCGARSDRDDTDDTSRTASFNAATDAETTGGEITVYAAASLRESLDELGDAYERSHGTKVTFNYAGSNELAKQIVASPGAADVFLSAAENWMDTVEQAERIVAGSRVNLLSNTLVVVASTASGFSVSNPCDLATIDMKNLALADPDAVPAGKYAKQWLSRVECEGRTLWDAVRDDVAPSPDVRAALGLVLADPAFVGIVYRTDQLAFADDTKVLHEVVDGPPILYVIAQVSEGKGGPRGRAFTDYLKSPEARVVFEKHGFTVTAQIADAK